MNDKIIKVIGIVASVIGIGASLANDWVNEQKMNSIIEEKVNEAMTIKDENEEEE